MRVWQSRARVVVAAVGVVAAVVVYATMKQRAEPMPVPPLERIDPAALIESSGNLVRQVRGVKQDFLIKAAQQLSYAGGATRLMGVEVAVSNRGGRDFVIRAREAQAGERQQELHLRGSVTLRSSDGFELVTEEAFFSEESGQVRAPGAFTFARQLLVGSGDGMTYDRTTDVLSVIAAADIRLTDAGGNTRTRFLAGQAVFTRPEHMIALANMVHILHNERAADAASATAHLSDDDSLLRRVELRGAAEVEGGDQGFDKLRADAIDLDYAGDGEQLSRVALSGHAVMSTTDGSGGTGRSVRGSTIELSMDEVGALSAIAARDGVQLSLPGGLRAEPRTIEARQLDADAGPNGSMTAARFEGNVSYREAIGASERTAQSRALRISLSGDDVETATFSGAATFTDGRIRAAGATLSYIPVKGSLLISGTDSGGGPRLQDEQLSVGAQEIALTLADRSVEATGRVRTTLRAKDADTGRSEPDERTEARLPGLFKSSAPANGNGDRFRYTGRTGQLAYDGNAMLWQAGTMVRGTAIVVDQRSGDLRISGQARSTLSLASGSADGRGAAIAYVESERTITYRGDATGHATLDSPAGDLDAGVIAVALGGAESQVERLEASDAVTLVLDKRTAKGATLVYLAKDERYVMSGSPRSPVTITEHCRETTGTTVTFYKSSDRIVIDGSPAARAQSVRGAACTEVQAR